MFRASAVLLSFLLYASMAIGQAPHGIPLKPDPPIAVDGDLGDWTRVPNAIHLGDAPQAVFGAGAWTAAGDISGTVHLAWRQEYLFLSATVVDDHIAQGQRASGIWQGDHVELYLDTQPDLDPGRASFGEGQFHIALSPGNFKTTGDPLIDTRPEAFCYTPRGKDLGDVLIASTQTASGWVIEAAIPWSLLNVEPEAGLPLRVEVGLSDTDGTEARQETLLTMGTAAWEHTRARLQPMALAGADGVAVARATSVPVFDALEVAQGQKTALQFDAPPLPEGRLAVLRLFARLHFDEVAGYTQALRIHLNGQTLAGERLLNKELRQKSRGGNVYSMYAGDQLSTYYSPDFDAPNSNNHYGLLDGVVPCLFELDVTDLIRPGSNDLAIEHSADERIKNALFAKNATLEFQAPQAAAEAKAGPPTGPLEAYSPRRELRTDFTAEMLPDARIALHFAGVDVEVASQFSTPEPAWVHGSNPYFTHDRRIDLREEGVVIYDTFTNLTAENLGIMHRHQAALGAGLKKLWVTGLEQPGASGRASLPANCTTFGAADSWGLGLVAADDVFRVHSNNYGQEGVIGLADNNLVLPPGATYTAEWILVPALSPDYYDFLNVARRFIGTNFLIDGGFAFLRAGALTDVWSDEQVKQFLEFKSPKYVCASIDNDYKGRYSHGTAFQYVDHERFKKSFARWRGLYPQGNYQVYFHCFLDVTDEGPEQFADARILRPDGKQADYGKEHQRLYLPMEGKAYGAAVRKNVDIILDEIGADGVYWDEHEYSSAQYHYGEPWDRYSGDIDPVSMRVRGLKSSVTLLSESWRVGLAKSIQSRGSLVGNSAPYTRAMAALKFPCFVETGSITNCTQAHLYSPIALGDHLTEESQQDAYETMLAALDYGCVYHWYNDMTVTPTHPTITSYMFPITPLELHAGYIIGEERIVTKISGRFGWNDNAQHELHVFDDTGYETKDYQAEVVEEAGMTWTELRIAEDWSAVIVRR